VYNDKQSTIFQTEIKIIYEDCNNFLGCPSVQNLQRTQQQGA
jgi:hypothetical protein